MCEETNDEVKLNEFVHPNSRSSSSLASGEFKFKNGEDILQRA
jgi:hypothetical protein